VGSTDEGKRTEAGHRGGAARSSDEVCESRLSEGGASFGFEHEPTGKREELVSEAKPFRIPKRVVWEAYLHVKANGGAAGIDSERMEDFEEDLKGNLYRIWNRMSSGTYFPPPVRQVAIPKRDGGERKLGIPTVSDRIAQSVVKMYLEPVVEPSFHPDSYGYRPGKSAVQAVGRARGRCWKFNWVLDIDVRSFLDASSHCTSICWGEIKKGGCCVRKLDSQAFSSSLLDVNSLKLAALYTLQDSLPADA
jgi:RNA-directed DNA polymerase